MPTPPPPLPSLPPDVRSSAEGHLPRGLPIHVLCKEGQRAYNVTRLLTQRGFDARLVSGGMTTYLMRRGLPVPKYRTPIPGTDFARGENEKG